MKKMMISIIVIVLALSLAACSVGNPDQNPVSGNLSTPLAEYSSYTATDNNLDSVVSVEGVTTEAVEDIIADEPEEDESIYEYELAVDDIIELGGHEWRVLDLKGGKALVLSERILMKRAYYSENMPVTWEECDLRQYLNREFFDFAFSMEEKGRIAETKLSTHNNSWYGTKGGNDTKDRVFLLSLEEVVKYFGDSGELVTRPDDLAFIISDQFNTARIAQTQEGNTAWWWLRSPGMFWYGCGSNHIWAAIIAGNGGIGIQGDYVTNEGGIRPALWLKDAAKSTEAPLTN